jgi:hypothetical protein
LEAAARYESSIRLYRGVVDTGRAGGSAGDGSQAAYVTGALQVSVCVSSRARVLRRCVRHASSELHVDVVSSDALACEGT